MTTAKAVVAVAWILLLGCFFVATGSTVSLVGRLCFWLMAAIHVVECVIFLPILRGAPGSLVGHLLQTLLFGFFHVREVRALPSREATRS
jgi:uncharacterized protein YhhL (DUF1145 family)